MPPTRPRPSRSDRIAQFTPALFQFLRELKESNDRAWFEANRDRFERDVREPLIRFVIDFAPHLQKISPHFVADPRPSGGSVFRIYRDTRFSKDKSPYKTNAGVQFRHVAGKDVHAPGFYLHLEPDEVFAGCGLWHPDPPALARVRDAIVADTRQWQSIKSRLPPPFSVVGEQLSRPPRGYDATHSLIDDLRRKDFVMSLALDEATACAPDFLDRFVDVCRISAPFMRFLTESLALPWKP